MAAASKSKHPRLWVPGVLYVTDEREVRTGKHVGFNGSGKDFALSRCGHFGSISDWRHRVWLVQRSELTSEIINRHAIIIPETLLDPQRQRHARRWLAEQPLLCVSGAKVARLAEQGLRVYTVEMGVEGDGILRIEAKGGERPGWVLRGSLQRLLPPELRPEGDGSKRLVRAERPEVRGFIDRLMAHVSGDVLREAAVLNAMNARTLVEPGYGYYGATDGDAASIERVQRDLRGLEGLFAQIYKRAEAHRSDAKEIARSVTGAQHDADDVEIPVYGSARRSQLHELTVELSAEDDGGPEPVWEVAGELRQTLVLPPQPRWIVERVTLWRPKLQEVLRAELARDQKGRSPTRNAWLALALIVLLAALIALGYLVGGP